MCKKDYLYQIDKITFNDDTHTSFKPTRINIFVGPNNTGKSQVLREIRDFILFGNNRDNKLLIDAIDEILPNNFELFQQKYNITTSKSKPSNSYSRLSLIDPSLKKSSPKTVASSTEFDQSNFKNFFGEALVTYLDTENRLNLLNREENVKANLLNRNPENILEVLAKENNTSLLDNFANDLFGIHIEMFTQNYGSLYIKHKSENDIKKAEELSNNIVDYDKTVPNLDNQGDGEKSALGVFAGILYEKPIILLDEPEAFLHPPQAFQLGSEIASTFIEDNCDKQIFISTHSADFLRGILTVTGDIKVFRFVRSKDDKFIVYPFLAEKSAESTSDEARMNLKREPFSIQDVSEDKQTQVDELKKNNEHSNDASTKYDAISEVRNNKLLSSMNIIDGLFYDAAIITEAYSDSLFYRKCIELYEGKTQFYYVCGNGKSSLYEIAKFYKSMGIKCAVIPDIDILCSKDGNKNIYDLIDVLSNADDNSTIKKDIAKLKQKVLDENTPTVSSNAINKCLEEIKLYASGIGSQEEIDRINTEIKDVTKQLSSLSTTYKNFQNDGLAYFNNIEDINLTNSILDRLQKIGIFVVPVGRLESWFKDEHFNDKHEWIKSNIETLDIHKIESNQTLSCFLDKIINYF